MGQPWFDVTDYLGYADDGIPGSTKANINSTWEQNVDENFRVRWAIEESNNRLGFNKAYGFECDKNGGGYSPVGAATTNVIFVLSGEYADEDADNVERVYQGGMGFVGGVLCESSSVGDNAQIDFAGNDVWEIEACFQIVGADVADGDIIKIRPTGDIDAWSNTAAMDANKGAPPVFVISEHYTSLQYSRRA